MLRSNRSRASTASWIPATGWNNFVEGKSNQLARATALQVALKPGLAYNPFLLYGGTGLGKTHLLHAAGNLIVQNNPRARGLYLRSEEFIRAMMQAFLRQGKWDDFKRNYRSVDALLIDDVQFLAGKAPRRSSSTCSTPCTTPSSRS